MQLAELLATKGNRAITIAGSASAAEAAQTMHRQRVGSVIVTADNGLPRGIFTERDVMRLCAEGKAAQLDELQVADCMTTDVVLGSPDATIESIMELMTQRRFRHLPVVQDGRLIGVVSIGDLVKARLQETAAEAKLLRDYIQA